MKRFWLHSGLIAIGLVALVLDIYVRVVEARFLSELADELLKSWK